MNLYQKIIEVRKSIGTLNKDKQGYNFSYVTGDQILGKIKEKMDELGLILQPSTQEGKWHRHDYKNQYGKDKIDFLVWGQGSYTWINAEEPSEREVVLFAYFGQQGDDMAQAYGTALTYAERYFLLKYFGIPTDGDDPDLRRNEKPNETQKPIDKLKQTTEPDPNKVTVKMLIDMATLKGVTEKQILTTYHADFNKTVSEVKFIPADAKKALYDKLMTKPDKPHEEKK